MGSGVFAVPTLRLLNGMDLVEAVFTQPDKPAGRAMQLTPTPIKKEALSLGLEVIQISSLARDIDRYMSRFDTNSIDAVIVIDFGQIVPSWLLGKTRLGFINLHPSLLPQYRGAAPIQRAIMDGIERTGVTIFKLCEKMDAGPILLQEAHRIEEQETYGELSKRLSEAGAHLLLKSLQSLDDNKLTPQAQDDLQATFAPKISKNEECINWNKSALLISNLIRAMNPTPGAYTSINNKRIKIWKAIILQDSFGDSGDISLSVDGPIVSCGSGSLLLLTIQIEGKKPISGKEFSRYIESMEKKCFC